MPDIPLPKPQLPNSNNNTNNKPSVPPAAPAAAPKPPASTPPISTPPANPTSPKPSITGQLPKPPVAKPGLPPTPPQSPQPQSPQPPKPPQRGGAAPAPASASAPKNKPVPPVAGKPPAQPTPPADTPKVATAGNPIKKFLPLIIGGVLVLVMAVIGYFLLFAGRGNSTSVSIEPTTTGSTTNTPNNNRQQVPSQQTTLTYWGLWEPSEVMEEVFADFEAANPGVQIEYRKQSHVDYRSRLESAIAAGSGPDLFRYHSSWVPMLQEELSPIPSSVMSATEYQQTFYPVAAQMLNVQGQIVGMPLMYDGLGLYYNKQILSDANEQPPKTWAEVQSLAQKLTIKDSGDEIKRAGIALGNASNTEHFSDILGLLMLQNGADPTDPTTREAQDALLFYTQFVTKNKVWSEDLPSSTVAFARGDAAMMIAPSWRAHEVLAMNQDLDFGIVSMPTVGDQKIGWATFWAEGVNANSKNKDLSWALIDYLAQPEVLQKLYSAQSQTRAFGEIYPRVDMANLLANNEFVTSFLEDAPYARSWYMASYTHDKGLNDNMIKYYTDAVNQITSGTAPAQVVETLGLGANQLFRQYSLK
jgi:multiple sugar transport system substrate-binding protein